MLYYFFSLIFNIKKHLSKKGYKQTGNLLITNKKHLKQTKTIYKQNYIFTCIFLKVIWILFLPPIKCYLFICMAYEPLKQWYPKVCLSVRASYIFQLFHSVFMTHGWMIIFLTSLITSVFLQNNFVLVCLKSWNALLKPF